MVQQVGANGILSAAHGKGMIGSIEIQDQEAGDECVAQVCCP